MTFEEAKEKISELFIDPQVPGYSVGDFDPEFTGTIEDIEEIIESLEQTYLSDKSEVEKLQKQLNTAKYFFKNILDVNTSFYGGNSVRHLHNCVRVMRISAEKALKALEVGRG